MLALKYSGSAFLAVQEAWKIWLGRILPRFILRLSGYTLASLLQRRQRPVGILGKRDCVAASFLASELRDGTRLAYLR